MYSGLTEDLKRVDENMLNACGAYYCLAERRRFGYRRLQVLLVREGEATTSGYTGCMWRRSWAFAVSEDAAGPPPQRDWCYRRRPSRTRCRSRVSFFMNRFRTLGFVNYNGGSGLQVHSSLLNIVLHD